MIDLFLSRRAFGVKPRHLTQHGRRRCLARAQRSDVRRFFSTSKTHVRALLVDMSEDPTGALQDLRHCRPIPIKKSLIIVNNFVVNTTRFLNRFSKIVDEKLLKVSNNISRLETTLSILEAKLDSVPDLDGSSQATSAQTGASSGSSENNTNAAANAAAAPPQATTAPAVDPNAMKVKDDPAYARYFKLMKLGMPVEQINSLSAETDLDPNLLDTPDAISPSAGGGAAAQNAPAADSNGTGEEPVLELENGDTGKTAAGDDSAPKVLTVKEDPAFAKYFKMLSLGLPPPVVKHKMTMDGFDASIIDNPNDPSPNAGGLVVAEEA